MAGVYNFTIKQGEDFSRPLVWRDSNGEPVDLTGKTARLTAKVRFDDTDPVIEVTNTDDNLTLSTTDGLITISFSDTESRAMDFKYAGYDLFIDDYLLVSGEITLRKTYTDA